MRIFISGGTVIAKHCGTMVAARNPSPYERRVIRQIADWKTQSPALPARLADHASRPITWAVKRILPRSVVRTAIRSADAASQWMSHPAWLKSAAGGASVDELRTKSLPLSDRLSQRIGDVAQISALVNGAAAGLGGFLLAPLDVGTLTLTAMNAIRRTAHCYGFVLDQPHDRAYVLSVLVLAGARSPGDRQKQLVHLEDLGNWICARTIESLAIDALTSMFGRLAFAEAVPGVGAVLGSAFNLAYMRQVVADSRRIFQERWLRANGCMRVRREPTWPTRAGDYCSHRLYHLRRFGSERAR
jgi:hypothetical protein